ncbi:MAG: sulfotransferase [Myxococcales bacterium]|nr:sulfotransferase [Myxococcales bacterium]MCB9715693.1 sulfotransferase [Myxococcales bacterium]
MTSEASEAMGPASAVSAGSGGLGDPAVALTFLVCSERSGSNLIRSILNAHPEVFAPEPIHLGAFWERLDEFGDLRDDERWRALLAAIVEFLREWNGTLHPSVALRVDELLERIPRREFVAIYEHVYCRGLAASGKPRLFVKENHTAQRSPILLRHYPGARFVYQVRDPRDFLASCKRMSRFKYGSAEGALAVWCADQRAAAELRARLPPERMFRGRYETLIHEPERYLGELCERMGIPFVPQMLAFHETADAQRAAAHEAWRNLGRPIIRDNSGHYVQTLSPEEIALVETHAHALMLELGYPVDRPADPSIDGTGLSLPGEGEPHRRRVDDGSSSSVVHRVIDRHVAALAGR